MEVAWLCRCVVAGVPETDDERWGFGAVGSFCSARQPAPRGERMRKSGGVRRSRDMPVGLGSC